MNTTIESIKPVTSLTIRSAKGVKKITMLTAYDYPSAVLLDQHGVDIILVGDSLGMVVLGRQDTLSVTIDEIIHHTQAVTRGVKRAMVVSDMPFMTYELNVEMALSHAKKLVQASGVRAVKLEGGAFIVPQVTALVQSGIAVMGHLGLTPQRVATFGGFKVQGKTAEAAEQLLLDALALQDAGCFAIVLEAVPAPVAQYITAELNIPTIGIGAGPDCDGQVLVLHDMLGVTAGHIPSFVKRYADVASVQASAVEAYVAEVQQGIFPSSEQSFTMSEEEIEKLGKLKKKIPYV